MTAHTAAPPSLPTAAKSLGVPPEYIAHLQKVLAMYLGKEKEVNPKANKG